MTSVYRATLGAPKCYRGWRFTGSRIRNEAAGEGNAARGRGRGSGRGRGHSQNRPNQNNGRAGARIQEQNDDRDDQAVGNRYASICYLLNKILIR